MFIHLGGGQWASLQKVVGIFNIAAIEGSTINQEYLQRCEGKGRGRDPGNASSLVLLEGGEIFCSSICSSTLTRRAGEVGKWLKKG